MATGNFYPSEYGIYTLHTLSVEDAVLYLKDEGIEVTDENIAHEISMYEEFMVEEFPHMLEEALSERGVTMYEERDHIDCYDEDDKIIARLELSPGYYEGVQVLVEGDPEELLSYTFDEESYLEDYSPDIEPVLDALSSVTTELEVFARFSNGETWYQKVGKT